jgi:hypothetical protein
MSSVVSDSMVRSAFVESLIGLCCGEFFLGEVALAPGERYKLGPRSAADGHCEPLALLDAAQHAAGVVAQLRSGI